MHFTHSNVPPQSAPHASGSHTRQQEEQAPAVSANDGDDQKTGAWPLAAWLHTGTQRNAASHAERPFFAFASLHFAAWVHAWVWVWVGYRLSAKRG